jgi:hypothetical protein
LLFGRRIIGIASIFSTVSSVGHAASPAPPRTRPAIRLPPSCGLRGPDGPNIDSTVLWEAVAIDSSRHWCLPWSRH